MFVDTYFKWIPFNQIGNLVFKPTIQVFDLQKITAFKDNVNTASGCL
jgi:hypothetical protein